MDIIDEMQERAEAVSTTVEFLFGDVTEQDDQVIRAMIVLGGSDDQIVRAFGIAAVNPRVGREDKGRYAHGVLKNLMLEDADLPEPDECDDDLDIEAHGGFEY